MPLSRYRRPALIAACLLLVMAGPAIAGDLSSPSFVSRGGHISAGGSGMLIGTSFQGGGSAGQSEAIGPGGAATNLTTQSAGFWPVVEGGIPSLDLDGDDLQAFLDPDDDNDGLDDVVETLTGIFVSALDTGTHPLIADTDLDGFLDGLEVLAGSNPNDAGSVPFAAVPGLGLGPALVLGLSIAGVAWRRFRRGELR